MKKKIIRMIHAVWVGWSMLLRRMMIIHPPTPTPPSDRVIGWLWMISVSPVVTSSGRIILLMLFFSATTASSSCEPGGLIWAAGSEIVVAAIILIRHVCKLQISYSHTQHARPTRIFLTWTRKQWRHHPLVRERK